MTLSKPGHNLSREGSAKVSNDDTTSVTQDGPEGYHEDRTTEESEDDSIAAPYANFTSTSSKGEGQNHMEDDQVMERYQAKGGTNVESPRATGATPSPIPVMPSSFGSPFAYASYPYKQDFFIELLAQSTRVLFEQVVAEASSLKKLVSTSPTSLTKNSGIGYLCCLKERKSSSSDSDISEESDSGESNLELYSFRPDRNRFLLPLGRLFDSSNAGKSIEISRSSTSHTGESQYYVFNEGFRDFYINDQTIISGATAGPLSDFAVFEVAQSSFFWWRTAAAFNYDPSLKRKRHSEDDDGRISIKALKSDTDKSYQSDVGSRSPYKLETSSNLQVFPDSKNWLDEYRRRFRICEQRPIKFTNLITEVHPPHRCLLDELQSIDIILAIGAIWLGLIEAKVDYAYANTDLFSSIRSVRMVGTHAVKGPNHFVVPLILKEELQALSPESEEDTAKPLEPVFSVFQAGEKEKHQEDTTVTEKAKRKESDQENTPRPPLENQELQNRNHKGGISHFMLAIAEKVDRDSRNTVKDVQAKKALVRLRFMDSADGHLDKGLIRHFARNTIRNSGWLGDAWPHFDAREEYWVDVLRQSGNTCGEHTVLNAWAYMLGIPLATTRERALGAASYKEVRKMIVLALRGQLDSLTIRAWMQHSKYAVEESLSRLQQSQIQQSELPNNLRNMQTVALNEGAFNEIVNEMYAQEQTAKQTHATKRSATPVTPGNAPTQPSESIPKVVPRVTSPASSQDVASGHNQGSHHNLTSSHNPVASQGTATGHGATSGRNPAPIHIPASTHRPASNHSPKSSHNPAPSKDSSTSSSSSSGTSASPTSPAQNAPRIRPPATWQERLVHGLANNKGSRSRYPRRTQDATKDATIIPRYSNMADYEVVLGIAPIWEGLKRLGRADVDFTYAGLDIFSPGGHQRGPGAVAGWSRFIMPLFFSGVDPKELEHQGKGKREVDFVGHLLLCVAELVDKKPGQRMTVRLEILDSRTGLVSIRDILTKADDTIKRSGWLKVKGHETQIRYTNPIQRRVPRQVGYNACGLYTILNAWAYMLGISIHPGTYRRGRTAENEDDAVDMRFLDLGLELVNLALAGFMDTATIQAFFNTYGYSAEQRFGDPARAVVPAYAVGMNQDKLSRTLARRKAGYRIARARAKGKRFPDEDMARLMEPGMSEEQAWTALVMARGHVQKAMTWHFNGQPFGEMPRPEDALSPTTPESRKGTP